MKAIQVFYEGRVQGVGFRYSVRQITKGFNVTGWVRNLPDGRVELQVSGEDEEVNAFLEAIRQSDLGSLIKKESEHVLATPPDSRGFEIEHDRARYSRHRRHQNIPHAISTAPGRCLAGFESRDCSR